MILIENASIQPSGGVCLNVSVEIGHLSAPPRKSIFESSSIGRSEIF